MKISDEIIGALSGLALFWSIGAMVKSQVIDKYDANGNLINPNEVFCDEFGNLFYVGSRKFLYKDVLQLCSQAEGRARRLEV
jgi:hypothetical protein